MKYFLSVVVIATILHFVYKKPTSSDPNPYYNNPLPEFSLSDSRMNTYRSTELARGPYKYLIFWSTQVPRSAKDIEYITKKIADGSFKEAEFLFINVECPSYSEIALVEEWVAKRGYSFTTYYDISKNMLNELKASGAPLTVKVKGPEQKIVLIVDSPIQGIPLDRIP